MRVYEKADEIAAILFLSKIKGFGPVRFRELYEKIGSFARFLDLLLKSKDRIIDLRSFQKILGENVWSKLIQSLNNEAIKECKRTTKELLLETKKINGHLITFFDEHYPQNLYRTNQCIPIIYAIGDINILINNKFSAVVGTRNPSSWTIKETKKLVKRLVNQGYVIVSGLAKGIDAISHETALDNDGKTIAVVGCGPDVYYPSENRELQDRIKKLGLVISEYPFKTKVTSLSLKKRNKIIVGISDVLFITETSVYGGTMNSYLAAIEQKKPVKIFLPISNVGGNFTGNLKIYNDSKVNVEKVLTGKEPSLDKLKHIKAIIFDLDGTLWDSRTAICSTIHSLLKEEGIDVKKKQIQNALDSGSSPIDILKSFGFSKIYKFWTLYRKNYSKIRLFAPNEKDMLLQLKKYGKKIGVATALKGSIASELLKQFGFDEIISVVISPSDTRARKPSPIPILKSVERLGVSVNRSIYVGNTDVDILAAKKARCLSGVAAWNKSIFISKMPDYIFTKFDDLNLLIR